MSLAPRCWKCGAADVAIAYAGHQRAHCKRGYLEDHLEDHVHHEDVPTHRLHCRACGNDWIDSRGDFHCLPDGGVVNAIDLAKLRALIAERRRSKWAADGRYVYGDGTKYDFGDFEEPSQAELAVAAVNALPDLLAVYEAAVAWHAVHERPISAKRGVTTALWDAVDAVTRSREP